MTAIAALKCLDRLLRCCCLLGTVLVLRHAVAGGAGAGSAMPGELQSSQLQPRVGDTVVLKLTFTPFHALPQARVQFRTSKCGSLREQQVKLRDLPANRRQQVTARLKVRSPESCVVTAQVIEAEGKDYRIGSIYAVTLNAAARDNTPTQPGTTASGEKTIDAVVPGRGESEPSH